MDDLRSAVRLAVLNALECGEEDHESSFDEDVTGSEDVCLTCMTEAFRELFHGFGVPR